MSPPRWTRVVALFLVLSAVRGISGKIGGWDSGPNTQYHIQTDEGPERYFRYQTTSGQYRKERRLQDGTVIGSYGWVDANGLLRLRDYVADHKGYRILRTKMVRVGEPVTQRPAPISLSDYLKEKRREETAVTPAPTTTPRPEEEYVRPVTFRPYLWNPNGIDQAVYETVGAARYEPPSGNGAHENSPPKYDGVALTHNGFRYYLPRHYHEEETLPGDKRAGSFGYIDPFGIRRVIYYNTSPGSGFVHRKNNRYVGFQSTPYDPRV